MGYRGGTGLFARELRFVRDLLGRRGVGVGTSALRGELLPDSLSERTFSLPLRVILEIMRCRRPVFFGVKRDPEVVLVGEVAGGSGGPSARNSISSLALADMPLCGLYGVLFSFSDSSSLSEPPMISSRSSDSRFLATV